MSRSKSRTRRKIVIAVLLIVSLALVALDRRGRISSKVRTVAAHVFAPCQNWLRGFTLSLIGHGGEDLRDDGRKAAGTARLKALLRKAEEDNARLAAKLAALQEQIRDIKQVVGDLSGYPLMLVRANVLSRDYVLPDSGMKIDAGSRRGARKGHWVVYKSISEGKTAGVRTDQAVITADGMVGLVEQVGGHVSRVRLITSPECRLAARIMHWDAESHQWVAQPEIGVMQGTGDGRTMRLLHLPRSVDVSPGDYAVTATGETGVAEYLIIGEVTKVSYLPTDLTYGIVVRPRIDPDKLDRVYVLIPRSSLLP